MKRKAINNTQFLNISNMTAMSQWEYIATCHILRLWLIDILRIRRESTWTIAHSVVGCILFDSLSAKRCHTSSLRRYIWSDR